MTEQHFDNKQVKIFLLVSFALPYLLGIFMGYLYHRGMDVSIFPNAQMYYPAAGITLAILLTRKGDSTVPRRFFLFFLISAALMLSLVFFAPVLSATAMAVAMNLVLIATCIFGWIFLLTEKKEKREAYGLRWHKTGLSAWMVFLFVAFFLVRVLISALLSGTAAETVKALANGPMWLNMTAILIINFFLTFLPFFGEEYGWRYFFGPWLQNRYGMVKGVLILGILWGLWHLPINVFYYSPQTWLQSILAQQVTCITLGIFFAYTYQKTRNIWVPVILHYLNNNLAAMLGGGVSSLSNQVITWDIVLISALINGVIFVPFLLAKEFRKKPQELQEPEETE